MSTTDNTKDLEKDQTGNSLLRSKDDGGVDTPKNGHPSTHKGDSRPREGSSLNSPDSEDQLAENNKQGK